MKLFGATASYASSIGSFTKAPSYPVRSTRTERKVFSSPPAQSRARTQSIGSIIFFASPANSGSTNLVSPEVLRWLAPKAKTFPLHDRLRVAVPCGENPPFSIFKSADIGLTPTSLRTSRSVSRGEDQSMTGPISTEPCSARWNLGVFGEQMRDISCWRDGISCTGYGCDGNCVFGRVHATDLDKSID